MKKVAKDTSWETSPFVFDEVCEGDSPAIPDSMIATGEGPAREALRHMRTLISKSNSRYLQQDILLWKPEVDIAIAYL